MIGALAMERIKFFSVRSTYWYLGLLLVLSWAISLIGVLATPYGGWDMAEAQVSVPFALMIYLVLATLVLTSEYRTGTIRVSLQAVGSRTQVYLAKAILVMTIGFGTGVVLALGNVAIFKVIGQERAEMVVFNSIDDWRHFFGPAILLAVGGVLALGIGALIRHSAGAITGMLLYALLVESMVMIIESGRKVAGYLPVNAAFQFVNPAGVRGLFGRVAVFPAPGPAAGLAIFAATAVCFYLAGLAALRLRDA